MARTDFRSTFHCLVAVSILITCNCNMSYSVPTYPTPTKTARSQAVVRREATQSRVLAAVEMKLGVSVMKRFIVSSTVYIVEFTYNYTYKQILQQIVTTTDYALHCGIL